MKKIKPILFPIKIKSNYSNSVLSNEKMISILSVTLYKYSLLKFVWCFEKNGIQSSMYGICTVSLKKGTSKIEILTNMVTILPKFRTIKSYIRTFLEL